MARGDWSGYWRATRWLMASVLVLWLLIGLGVSILTADIWPTLVLGYPIGYLLTALISPIALVGLAFWFADRQDRLDRDYGMSDGD